MVHLPHGRIVAFWYLSARIIIGIAAKRVVLSELFGGQNGGHLKMRRKMREA